MKKNLPYLEPRLKRFIEWDLERYREMKREIDEYRLSVLPSTTPSYSGVPSGGGSSSSTERSAVKLATSVYLADLERTVKAISDVIEKLDDTDRALVDLIYWKRQYTVEGAGYAVGMSKTTAYRHINGILVAVAANLGLVTI